MGEGGELFTGKDSLPVSGITLLTAAVRPSEHVVETVDRNSREEWRSNIREVIATVERAQADDKTRTMGTTVEPFQAPAKGMDMADPAALMGQNLARTVHKAVHKGALECRANGARDLTRF